MLASDYTAKMQSIFANSTFFDLSTLSFVLVQADMYLPSIDIFYTVRAGIEIGSSTLIKPCKIDV